MDEDFDFFGADIWGSDVRRFLKRVDFDSCCFNLS